MSMQKETQKQMNSVVAGPINKEGKRVETALGRTMEKALKANIDALWVRIQDETAKHEKAEKDQVQQLTSVITNFMNKDMPAMLERALKKEISSVGPALARAVTPAIEKSISSAIADSFQVFFLSEPSSFVQLEFLFPDLLSDLFICRGALQTRRWGSWKNLSILNLKLLWLGRF